MFQLKKPEQAETVITNMLARRVAFTIAKNNPNKIDTWLEWVDKGLALKPGDEPIKLEWLLTELLNQADLEPLLQKDIEDVISLFEMPQIQPPDSQYLTALYIERIQLIFKGFKEGLELAKEI